MMQLVGYDMAAAAAKAVYEATDLGPEDIDVVELHDCFAHNELITYEALGLCPEGGAASFIADGDNSYGGRYVTNPSGACFRRDIRSERQGLPNAMNWPINCAARPMPVRSKAHEPRSNTISASAAPASSPSISERNDDRPESHRNEVRVVVVPVEAGQLTETVMPPAMLAGLGPALLTPLVVFLCSEEYTESGQIFEIGSGWVTRLRWEQSRGALFDPGTNFDVEVLAKRWNEVQSFENAMHPEGLGNTLKIVRRTPRHRHGAGTAIAQKCRALSSKCLIPRSDGAPFPASAAKSMADVWFTDAALMLRETRNGHSAPTAFRRRAEKRAR